MKNEAPQLKNEGIDLLKEVKKEAMNGEKQKKEKHVKKGAAEDEKQEKVEQPWTDRERSIIIQHILTHVLANAGYGSISRELGGILAREGFFIRNTKAYSNDAPSSLRSPAKTPSPSKASAESPSKRKRVAKKGDADE